MDPEQRRYLRHPSAIPVVVRRMRRRPGHASMQDASLGGLTFEFPKALAIGGMISVAVPSVTHAELHGHIVWSAKRGHGYIIGMAFASEQDALRSRIVEQICHIETYRREQLEHHGRPLSLEQAAGEWIRRHAAGFPLQVF